MDEKSKRDVVKKVLKDTHFENPTENIQTELKEDAPRIVLEELEHKEEMDKSSKEDITNVYEEDATEKFDSEIKIEDEFGFNPTKSKMMGDQPKKEAVIQRVGNVAKLRESTENLDTSLVGIFRNFFSKSQLRYASNNDEKL